MGAPGPLRKSGYLYRAALYVSMLSLVTKMLPESFLNDAGFFPFEMKSTRIFAPPAGDPSGRSALPEMRVPFSRTASADLFALGRGCVPRIAKSGWITTRILAHFSGSGESSRTALRSAPTAVPESITCSATYVVTQADMTAGSVTNHATAARDTGGAACAFCHAPAYCAQCHASATAPMRTEIRFPEKVQSDFIHRADFVSRHQIEAAANPASCKKCHGSYFCDSCHSEQGISARTLNPRDPHPIPAWTTKGSGNFHGDAARANIVACSGCHGNAAANTYWPDTSATSNLGTYPDRAAEIRDHTARLAATIAHDPLPSVERMAEAAFAQLAHLRTLGPDPVVLARRGPVLLSTMVTSRLLELVVHGDDLVRSTRLLAQGDPGPLEAGAVAVVADALLDVLVARGGWRVEVLDPVGWLRLACGRAPLDPLALQAALQPAHPGDSLPDVGRLLPLL